MLAISCPDCWELVATLLLNQPSLNVRYSTGRLGVGLSRLVSGGSPICRVPGQELWAKYNEAADNELR